MITRLDRHIRRILGREQKKATKAFGKSTWNLGINPNQKNLAREGSGWVWLTLTTSAFAVYHIGRFLFLVARAIWRRLF